MRKYPQPCEQLGLAACVATTAVAIRYPLYSAILFVLVMAMAGVAGLGGAGPVAVRDFGTSSGKPINNGFVIVDGIYIEAPYTVSRRALDIYINDALVRQGAEWPRPDRTVSVDPGPPPKGVKPWDRPASGDVEDRYWARKWRYVKANMTHKEAVAFMKKTLEVSDAFVKVKWGPEPDTIIVQEANGSETPISYAQSGERTLGDMSKAGLFALHERYREFYEKLLRAGMLLMNNKGIELYVTEQQLRGGVLRVNKGGGELNVAGKHGKDALAVLLGPDSLDQKFAELEKLGVISSTNSTLRPDNLRFRASEQLSQRLEKLKPSAAHATPDLKQEPDGSKSSRPDYLLDGSPYKAGVYRGKRGDEIVLSNGLVRRTFRLAPNAATVGLDNLATGEAILRGVKPEAEVEIDGVRYEIGGLKGQPNYAFLRPEWIDGLKANPAAFQFTGFEVGKPKERLGWKQVRHQAPNLEWPPEGVYLRMDYRMPEPTAETPAALTKEMESKRRIRVSVHYELYDGLPVFSKWITVHNDGDHAVTVNRFTSEILAAVEYGSAVESREYGVQAPNIHVDTDYAFASFNAEDANHQAVHWEADPDYETQVNYQRLTPCLLRVGPGTGPGQEIAPGGSLESFRAFVLPYDGYDRERNGLALRRMYRTIAPWITENPLMMHARFADWDRVKLAIDQCAEVGFEMVILTFGSGFDLEDESEGNLARARQLSEYARGKGIEIGTYSLLASRSVGGGNDVVMPEGKSPTFGNSPCIESRWGLDYFRKLHQFYEKTGFQLLEHDGSYPGDVCAATDHPGHRGLEDSQWTQWRTISDFYKWCRANGVYLNVPDYYYLCGSNKCGMGYRETNWSLPREQQVIHTRQNIYDGAWEKTPSMGWMFVPLTEYHGGGAAATIEPLHEHLDHYEKMMASNLGAGVQACYRGPRLYDTDETKAMVKKWVDWYKKHREILESDIIHLRRADGRDVDYFLHVNPAGKEKAMLVVFNPLSREVKKTVSVPLYYSGLTKRARVSEDDGKAKKYTLARDYTIEIEVTVPAGGAKWFVIE